MNKTIYHITARHKKSLQVVDLYFVDLKTAKKHNQNMEDFSIIGVAK